MYRTIYGRLGMINISNVLIMSADICSCLLIYALSMDQTLFARRTVTHEAAYESKTDQRCKPLEQLVCMPSGLFFKGKLTIISALRRIHGT
jgi:hypothetical protein